MKLTTLGHRGYKQHVSNEWIRLLQFPESRPARWPTRWVPLLELIVRRRRRPSRKRGEWRDDHGRAGRQAVDHVAQIMVAAWMGFFSWRRLWSNENCILREALKGTGEAGSVGTSDLTGRRESFRVAYVGPTPRKGTGGPPGCAWLVLEELARSGTELDLYLTITEDRKEFTALGLLPGAKVIAVGSVWRWNRWYSKNRLMAVVTGLGSIALARRRLVNLLVEQHKLAPYDAMYQFSTIEVFGRPWDSTSFPRWFYIRVSMRRESCTGCGESGNCRGVVKAG